MESIYPSLISPKGNFFLIAGPCVVENREVTFTVAREAAAVCRDLEIPFFFQSLLPEGQPLVAPLLHWNRG